MRIRVTADAFLWTRADGTILSAASLRAPESCIFEPFEVFRDGAPFDTGAILHIADAGFDGFEGMETTFGEHKALKMLEPKLFRPGDEIEINLLRGNVPEAEYWVGMTAEPGAA